MFLPCKGFKRKPHWSEGLPMQEEEVPISSKQIINKIINTNK